jgi:hypothetical protein
MRSFEHAKGHLGWAGLLQALLEARCSALPPGQLLRRLLDDCCLPCARYYYYYDYDYDYDYDYYYYYYYYYYTRSLPMGGQGSSAGKLQSKGCHKSYALSDLRASRHETLA